MSLLKLEKGFVGVGEVNGVIFTQVAENEKGYMYKVELENETYYEVFKKESSPICLDFSKKIYSETDFKEVYPKSNKFGYSAWTFKNEQKAKEQFNRLINL